MTFPTQCYPCTCCWCPSTNATQKTWIWECMLHQFWEFRCICQTDSWFHSLIKTTLPRVWQAAELLFTTNETFTQCHWKIISGSAAQLVTVTHLPLTLLQEDTQVSVPRPTIHQRQPCSPSPLSTPRLTQSHPLQSSQVPFPSHSWIYWGWMLLQILRCLLRAPLQRTRLLLMATRAKGTLNAMLSSDHSGIKRSLKSIPKSQCTPCYTSI